MIFIISALALSGTLALAAPANMPTAFTEQSENKIKAAKELHKIKEKEASGDFFTGSDQLKKMYRKYADKVYPPGFISSRPINKIAKIVGPDVHSTSFRTGDTVYLRWLGAPGPRVGDTYQTYHPMIVLQDLNDPTNFTVRAELSPEESIGRGIRLAGFFYEANGSLKITKVSQGLVEASIHQLNGTINLQDQLMPPIPAIEKLEKTEGGVQLAAAIVCGSPHDRLSTTKKSFIYVNRGSRDGIQVGRTFEAVESVNLDESNMTGPEVSVGEAVVVHTTESFSTAMITKQFDVIRIGSLLKTKQSGDHTQPKIPFSAFNKNLDESYSEVKMPEPTDEAFQENSLTLPAKPQKQLSELDALERSQNLSPLTESEKTRLQKLSKQSQKKAEKIEEKEKEDPLAFEAGDSDLPKIPQTENSFKQGKESAKKEDKKKKKKKTNDEEELNLLMMQN